MFGGIKNISQLMKMASQAQEHMKHMDAELEAQSVEGESGGGAVRVVLNGKGRVMQLNLDANLLAGLAGDDKVVVEELIASAFNSAMEKVQELLKEQAQQAMGGADMSSIQKMFQQDGT